MVNAKILISLLLAAASARDASANEPAQAPAIQAPIQAPAVPPPTARLLAVKPPALPPAASSSDKPSPPAELAFSDGFVMRTLDKKNELKLQASTQIDGRAYPGNYTPSGFDLRRSRIDLNAKLLGLADIRIQAAMEDNPYIRNAFVDLAVHRALHFRAGQMKVPFSTQWLTLDNQVDFLERSTAEPLYPFIERGAMVWGALLNERVIYNAGVFNGAGVDLDTPKGDIDSQKEVAYRVFLQPFRDLGPTFIQGLYLAGGGTWESASIPTRRFETRGLTAPDYESLVWRWRTEQVIGSNGRNTDQIAATIDSKMRWGVELHYQLGPLTVSGEWAMIRYQGIQIFHDLIQGSTRLRHDPVGDAQDGAIHNVSGQVSVFVTGEKKYVDNFGWKQPTPRRRIAAGEKGYGAIELLARFSRTWVPAEDHDLFTATKVAGFSTADGTGIKGPLPGEGASSDPTKPNLGSVNAQVLDGAKLFYEASAGVNWTLNYHARLQLNYTYMTAPDSSTDANTGVVSGGIVSGGNSENFDITTKNTQVESEHFLGARLIFRI